MAQDWQVEKARQLICWPYESVEPIRKALTAGDSESEDREGHRSLAQHGASIIQLVIATICYQGGISRQQQNATQKLAQQKTECAVRARMCRLDELVKISTRQFHEGPQPTVLKNTMFALVAVVWLEAQNWSHTLTAMSSLGLLCRRDTYIDPRELASTVTTGLLDDSLPYDAPLTSTVTDQTIYGTINRAGDAVWHDASGGVERPGSPMELEQTVSFAAHTPVLTPPSSLGSWSYLDLDTSLLNATPTPSLESCNDISINIEGSFALRVGEENRQTRKESSEVSRRSSEAAIVASPMRGAFVALSAAHHETLWQMVQYIGSHAAIQSLHLVISNFRTLQQNGVGKESATKIGITRSVAQRLAAIEDLSACMAHFTVAKRMHIYMLYREADAEGPQSQIDNDHFVIESGISHARPRGNPNHLRPAAISRKMALLGQSEVRAKMMRRVGQRLDLFVQTFGSGVLALLDEGLSQTMLLKVTDSVFTEFVHLVDGFEGEQIRRISCRAKPIVDMLFNASDDIHMPIFGFETLNGQGPSISQSPRCSSELADLLLPHDT